MIIVIPMVNIENLKGEERMIQEYKQHRAKRRMKRKSGTNISSECICPNCGEKVYHKRGVPCFEEKCPKCGISMERLKYLRSRKYARIWYANL